MKSLSARLIVAALALTGFAASSMISKAAPAKKVTPAVVAMGTSPAALCMPKNWQACALD